MTDAHDCCARGSAYRSDDSSDHRVLVRFFEKAEPDWGEEQSEISLQVRLMQKLDFRTCQISFKGYIVA